MKQAHHFRYRHSRAHRRVGRMVGRVIGTACALPFFIAACASSSTQVVSEQPVPKKICFNFKPGFGIYVGTLVRHDASDQEVTFNGQRYFTGALPILATDNIISIGEDPSPALSRGAPAPPVYLFKLMEPARAALSGATFKRRGDFLIVKNLQHVYSASKIMSQIDQDNFAWSPPSGDHVFEEICQN